MHLVCTVWPVNTLWYTNIVLCFPLWFSRLCEKLKNCMRWYRSNKKNKAYNLRTNPLIPIGGEGDWKGWKVMKIILSRFNLFTGFNLSEVTRHELYSWESWWMFYLRAKVNNREGSYCFSNTMSIYRPQIHIATSAKTVNTCIDPKRGIYVYVRERGDQ